MSIHTKKRAVYFSSLLAAIFLILSTSTASAAMLTYQFSKLTNNNAEDLSSQLSISMWDASQANAQFGTSLSTNDILFTVHNEANISSNIAEVFFDDGGLLAGPSTVINNLGGYTNFSGGGAKPGNLPGRNLADNPFDATNELSADANPGPPRNGVNSADDILGIVLGLGSYLDFDAVAQAIQAEELRFGLHVRSIGARDGSDSYISVNPVPLPAAVWLFGSALLVLLGLRRRK